MVVYPSYLRLVLWCLSLVPSQTELSPFFNIRSKSVSLRDAPLRDELNNVLFALFQIIAGTFYAPVMRDRMNSPYGFFS